MRIVIIYVTIFIGEGLLAQIILPMNSNQLAKAFAVIMFLMRLLQIVTDVCNLAVTTSVKWGVNQKDIGVKIFYLWKVIHERISKLNLVFFSFSR